MRTQYFVLLSCIECHNQSTFQTKCWVQMRCVCDKKKSDFSSIKTKFCTTYPGLITQLKIRWVISSAHDNLSLKYILCCRTQWSCSPHFHCVLFLKYDEVLTMLRRKIMLNPINWKNGLASVISLFLTHIKSLNTFQTVKQLKNMNAKWNLNLNTRVKAKVQSKYF